ncbi:iron-sulfur cluster assembly scaffold protein [Geminicoccaceae bacterium 1502E]|nr:iron-sulfur cluster assembly scaffold protein [Geminicoccaceae bacterium 1502E]
MSDDGLALYSDRLRALSAKVRKDRRLAAADATVSLTSPLCGSRVTIDLVMESGRIRELGYMVRACSLGQAGTAVLAEAAPGCTPAELEAVRETVRRMLEEGGPPPEGHWAALEVLSPAAHMPSRHGAALLPFDAVLEAAGKAAQPPL